MSRSIIVFSLIITIGCQRQTSTNQIQIKNECILEEVAEINIDFHRELNDSYQELIFGSEENKYLYEITFIRNRDGRANPTVKKLAIGTNKVILSSMDHGTRDDSLISEVTVKKIKWLIDQLDQGHFYQTCEFSGFHNLWDYYSFKKEGSEFFSVLTKNGNLHCMRNEDDQRIQVLLQLVELFNKF